MPDFSDFGGIERAPISPSYMMLDSLRGLAVSSCILIAASSGVQCIGTKRSGGGDVQPAPSAEASSSQTTACWTAKETLGVQYGRETRLDEERRASFNRIYFDDLKQSSFFISAYLSNASCFVQGLFARAPSALARII